MKMDNEENKISKEQWTHAVGEARRILGTIQELEKQLEVYQVRMCMICASVCTIRHGGRSNGIYTIKNFAKDVGMHAKTLQNWMSCYREVILKLPEGTYVNDAINWTACIKTLRNMKDMQARARKKVGAEGRKKKIIEFSSEKVTTLFKETRDNSESNWTTEFVNCKASTKRFKHLLTVKDMRRIDNEQLIEMMELLDHCSDAINDFLTEQKKVSKAS